MLKSDSNSWNSPVSTRNRRIYQKSTTSRGWQFFDVNVWPKSNMQNSAYSRSATHEATFIQSLYLFGFYMFKSDSNFWNSYQKSTTSRGWQLFNMNFWPKSNMQNSAYRKLFEAFPPLALLLFSVNISIKRLKMTSKFLKMPIYGHLKDTWCEKLCLYRQS